MRKNYFIYGIGVFLALIIVLGSVNRSKVNEDSKFDEADPTAYIVQAHDKVPFHIHPFLEIEILGEKIIIPSDIGVSNEGMRILHTHDATGKIHIESPKPYDFKLKDFFAIWGEVFNSDCIFDKCKDAEHEILFFVNDKASYEYENTVLKDGDKIRIVYKKRDG